MVTAMIVWAVVLVLCVIAELATLQLVSIWFAAGALGAFIAAACGFSAAAQAVIFAAVSVLLLCLTRPLLRKMRVRNVLPTNAQAEVGRLAVVTEDIDNAADTGRVRIGGVNWKARADGTERIPKGASVRVTGIDGTTAFVTTAE